MPVLSMCKRNDRIMTVVGTLVVIIILCKCKINTVSFVFPFK